MAKTRTSGIRGIEQSKGWVVSARFGNICLRIVSPLHIQAPGVSWVDCRSPGRQCRMTIEKLKCVIPSEQSTFCISNHIKSPFPVQFPNLVSISLALGPGSWLTLPVPGLSRSVFMFYWSFHLIQSSLPFAHTLFRVFFYLLFSHCLNFSTS